MIAHTEMIPVSLEGSDLVLVSHHLCPYVQRAAISLAEKDVPFERRWVDLSDKPAWFGKLSPTGKVPLLVITHEERPDTTIFESSVILEYLEETQPNPLHPRDPLERARHRAWMEFGSAVLNGIARLYTANDKSGLQRETIALRTMFQQLENELSERLDRQMVEHSNEGPFFSGSNFSLVDAVFGPVFRYLDTFEVDANLKLVDGLARIKQWRAALVDRPSVSGAIDAGYPDRLRDFLIKRESALSERILTRQTSEAPCASY